MLEEVERVDHRAPHGTVEVTVLPSTEPLGSDRPIGIQASSVSANGYPKATDGASPEFFLHTLSRNVPRSEPSIAVSAASPSPMAMWGGSPT